MNFTEYVEFIYLNSHLSKDEAFKIANECWNKGLNKYEALEYVLNN